jgi:hypothetical protein
MKYEIPRVSIWDPKELRPKVFTLLLNISSHSSPCHESRNRAALIRSSAQITPPRTGHLPTIPQLDFSGVVDCIALVFNQHTVHWTAL